MELHPGLLKTAIILFLFVQFGLCRRMGLGSRTETLALHELRSSLGISGKDWAIKAKPCYWTGVQCENGRVVSVNMTGLRRTRTGRIQARFAVDSLANLTRLGSFSASGFLMNGSIPEWLGHRLRKLEELDLRSCSLIGSIPSSLSGLKRLKSLRLSNNSLTGRVPSELGTLSRLMVLDLSVNSLTGAVPSTFSSLKNLTLLDLSSNFLSGSVPSYLGVLSNLQFLNLSDNGLTDSVPPQLGNLSNLVRLDLSKNSLSGSLPDVLFSRLEKLQMLVLNDNTFDGVFPATLLWSGPDFHFLDLSSNTLTGPLPNFTASINNVYYSVATLNLSNNLFYGPLNTTWVSKFGKIDLSGNYFQGEVEIGGFEFSSNVSLARNCLEMVLKQRDFGDCKVFYVERGLPFSSGAEKPLQPPLHDSESGNKKPVIFILVGIFGGLGFIVLLVLIIILLLKRYDSHDNIAIQRGTANKGPVPEVESPIPTLPKDTVFVAGVGEAFTLDQMLLLTGNFAEANLIKHGHSGDLFWGTLEGGVTTVVKRVDLNLFKKESYMVELELFSKVSHARLVPLLGHCLENEREKCIVYKYMPNGDLASSLHGVACSGDKRQPLDWITRLKIAIGAAEGLSYLHECSPSLVHRDVQASSILLDDKFEVRLGSLSEVTTAQEDLHHNVITRIFRKSSSFDQGNSGASFATCAYDVHCFGKVLLELITGNVGVSKSDEAATKEWLEQTLPYINIYDKEQVTRIVDPSLILDDDLLEEVWAMAIVARSCLNPKPSKRPPMRYVFKALENPVKIVREENNSSARLRTTSSRRSWSFAFFGSWRQSSLETVTNRDSTSGFKQPGRVGSQGSCGNDHSSSHKRSSNEIFPEPLDMQEMERLDEHYANDEFD